jgi:LAO/AO transport system kinase
VQAMKAGLLEIADVFVVNKADRDGAARMKSELELMLQLRPAGGWNVPVLLTVASEGRGIDELLGMLDAHAAHLRDSGDGARRAADGRHDEFVAALRDELARRLDRGLRRGPLATVAESVRNGALDPYAALRQILADPQLLETLLAAQGTASDAPK